MKALAVCRIMYVEGNPAETIKATIVQYGYKILGHHDKKEDDVVLEREVITKSHQINLLKRISSTGLNTKRLKRINND